MSKGWDNTTLKKLKSLMGKGLSTSEIGKRLGMSKNAVVGKLNRLGWNLKAGGAPVSTDDAKTSAATKKTQTAKKAGATTKKATTPTKATSGKKVADKSVGAKAAPKKATAKSAEKTPAKVVATPRASKTSQKNLAMHQRIIQHSLEMANLKPNQCRWPIGDPDSEHFHFCGETVFVGKPYCYEHCRQAYQFAPPKKK